MFASKKNIVIYSLTCMLCLFQAPSYAINKQTAKPTLPDNKPLTSLDADAIATALGWTKSSLNYCGGYYHDLPYVYPLDVAKSNLVAITGNQGLLALRGPTSFLENKVTVTYDGQQLTSDKAIVYRENKTGKLNRIEMLGNVHLREPNALMIAKQGSYNFANKSKTLLDILYRTKFINKADNSDTLTAWGKAEEFKQDKPKVYQLNVATFSTCPPDSVAWQLKASNITLDKNIGRGYASHARILVKGVPVFYTPYINFSIDKQRKTGFLWPTIATSKTWGPYLVTPFYWNMAPNYDMTISPGLLAEGGLRMVDNFRYLTTMNHGAINIDFLPNDRYFDKFKDKNLNLYQNNSDPMTRSELNRLLHDSSFRKAFYWRDDAQFNEHWSSHVDLNYVSDDYYLQDFGSNLNEISQNQLLQEASIYYKSQHWDFIGRLQAYQTLHPINSPVVLNQYRRFPQLILNADYPNQALGLEYFVNTELTHFDMRKTPGMDINLPVGDRVHLQPGISLPLYWPYFFVNPRLQLALSAYDLHQTVGTTAPPSLTRAVPIFDVVSGLSLSRPVSLFNHKFTQTLEPQIYYTFIPFRHQENIPIFDTTVNTLVYDQIFNYNRFSGIDRIGDANQMAVGITTRLIDQKSGIEKVRLGLGEIVYFANRNVTLCNDTTCTDNPQNHSNYQRLSPLSGLLSYTVNTHWNFSANTIWNPVSKQLDNGTFNFHYQPDANRIFNIGYGFARSGDVLSGITTTDSDDNLKVTDVSFAWPVKSGLSAVGRWSQNWNHRHLQNLLYGLQYDSCCWTVRLVGGRAFVTTDTNNNNKPIYRNEFYIQFNLKGLGNIGTGNPAGILGSINGYNTQFGQEI